MDRRYLTLGLAVSMLVILTAGCDSILNRDFGPRIVTDHLIGSLCGSDWTSNVGTAIYDGVPGRIVVQFDVGRVDQVFETSLSISSPTMPKEFTPEWTTYTFQVIKSDLAIGKSSGTVRVIYDISPKCGGAGAYIFDVIIIDENGRAATYQGSFKQGISVTNGTDVCKCAVQCGPCIETESTFFERCNCGCPYPGEQKDCINAMP